MSIRRMPVYLLVLFFQICFPSTVFFLREMLFYLFPTEKHCFLSELCKMKYYNMWKRL